MQYHVTHSIQFKDGTRTAPYRLLESWKTMRGAFKAGKAHAMGMDQYYENVAVHLIDVHDTSYGIARSAAIVSGR